MPHTINIKTSPLVQYIFSNTAVAPIWLIVRVYVGWQWLEAGWGKVINPAWTGATAGTALTGFLNGSLQKMNGAHPDVSAWYGSFITNFALPHVTIFSYIVAYGELLVGIGLILGVFTGIAAFFGATMNMNFLLAGAISVNPQLLLLELLLIFAWRNAGWVGGDRWVLPWLGTPWQSGKEIRGVSHT